MDSGGFWHFDYSKLENTESNPNVRLSLDVLKKQLKNVNIMATVNVEQSSCLDQRMLRHFNIIHIPNPRYHKRIIQESDINCVLHIFSLEDQKFIFSVLVKGHMFGSSITKNDYNHLHKIGGINMPEFIDQIIKITVDMQVF